MHRAPWIIAFAALLTAAGALLAQGPEGPPNLDEFLAKAATAIDGPINAHIRIDTQANVNGQIQPVQSQELWLRDYGHLRAEVPDQNVITTISPEQILLYHGTSGVALVVPKETLDGFGDDLESQLQQVGIGLPGRLFRTLGGGAEGVTIAGEQEIGGAECWVVNIAEESLDTWAEALGVSQQAGNGEVHFAQLSLQKDTAAFRGLNLQLDVVGPNGVKMSLVIAVTVPVIEEMEITDEMLSWELPDDATVITWTPDKQAPEVAMAFREAVIAGLQQ